MDFSNWNSSDSMDSHKDLNETEKDVWDGEESYGLELLFLDNESREEHEVCGYIEEMTRNKLYDIFIKMCPNGLKNYNSRRRLATTMTGVLTTPEKRKASPLPGLELANPAKTACQSLDNGRNRSQYIAAGVLNKQTSKGGRQRNRSVSTSTLPKGQMKVSTWFKPNNK